MFLREMLLQLIRGCIAFITANEADEWLKRLFRGVRQEPVGRVSYVSFETSEDVILGI